MTDMFNWIRRQFGEGKIRVEVQCSDGSNGIAKVNYIGDIDTLDLTEFEQHVKKVCFVEHGKRVTKIKILGYT